MRRESDALYERGEKIVADPPAAPAAALSLLCDVMVEGFLRDDRRLLRELFAAAVNSPASIGAKMFEADRRLAPLLSTLIEKLKARGFLDAKLDSVRAAGVLDGICMMWITAYLMDDALSADNVRGEVHRGIEIAMFGMIARRPKTETLHERGK